MLTALDALLPELVCNQDTADRLHAVYGAATWSVAIAATLVALLVVMKRSGFLGKCVRLAQSHFRTMVQELVAAF